MNQTQQGFNALEGFLGLANSVVAKRAATVNYLQAQGQAIQGEIEIARNATDRNINLARGIAEMRLTYGALGYSGASQLGTATIRPVFDYNRDAEGDSIAQLSIDSGLAGARADYRIARDRANLQGIGAVVGAAEGAYNIQQADRRAEVAAERQRIKDVRQAESDARRFAADVRRRHKERARWDSRRTQMRLRWQRKKQGGGNTSGGGGFDHSAVQF